MSPDKLPFPFAVIGGVSGLQDYYRDRDDAEEAAAYYTEADPSDPHFVFVLLEECQHVS